MGTTTSHKRTKTTWKKRIENLRNEKGFTLLEVIVAISILTVGLLAVASMQLSAIRGNAFAEGVTEATSLAVDRMEYLMALDYGDADVDDTDGDGIGGLNNATSDTADHNRTHYRDAYGHLYDYNLYWNSARNQPALNNTTIRVIVTWSERGAQRRVALDFIRANI